MSSLGHLEVRQAGELLFVPVAELALFAYGPLEPAVAALHDSYARALAHVEPSLRRYVSGDMKRYRPASPETLRIPLAWTGGDPSLRTYFADAGASEVRPPALEVTFDPEVDPPCASLRVVLPADVPEDALLALARELGAAFPLAWGHAGLALGATRLMPASAWRAARGVLLRHPGLGYGDAGLSAAGGAYGVLDVGWLVLLGPALAGQARPLVEGLPEVDGEALPTGGLLLRAGALRDTGDRNRGEALAARRSLARALLPVRPPRSILDNLSYRAFEAHEQRDWVDRLVRP